MIDNSSSLNRKEREKKKGIKTLFDLDVWKNLRIFILKPFKNHLDRNFGLFANSRRDCRPLLANRNLSPISSHFVRYARETEDGGT